MIIMIRFKRQADTIERIPANPIAGFYQSMVHLQGGEIRQNPKDRHNNHELDQAKSAGVGRQPLPCRSAAHG
jgi:hypothetical protein